MALVSCLVSCLVCSCHLAPRLHHGTSVLGAILNCCSCSKSPAENMNCSMRSGPTEHRQCRQWADCDTCTDGCQCRWRSASDLTTPDGRPRSQPSVTQPRRILFWHQDLSACSKVEVHINVWKALQLKHGNRGAMALPDYNPITCCAGAHGTYCQGLLRKCTCTT